MPTRKSSVRTNFARLAVFSLRNTFNLYSKILPGPDLLSSITFLSVTYRLTKNVEISTANLNGFTATASI